eukprot:scaffold53896_cov39-Phaeocystis_antarctica.AAC.2
MQGPQRLRWASAWALDVPAAPEQHNSLEAASVRSSNRQHACRGRQLSVTKQCTPRRPGPSAWHLRVQGH